MQSHSIQYVILFNTILSYTNILQWKYHRHELIWTIQYCLVLCETRWIFNLCTNFQFKWSLRFKQWLCLHHNYKSYYHNIIGHCISCMGISWGWNYPTNFLNKSPTKYSFEKLRYCPTNCIHIRIFDIFLAFDSDSLPFSSPHIGCRAAVFQVCKICAFNQSNTLVLIAKC